MMHGPIYIKFLLHVKLPLQFGERQHTTSPSFLRLTADAVVNGPRCAPNARTVIKTHSLDKLSIKSSPTANV